MKKNISCKLGTITYSGERLNETEMHRLAWLDPLDIRRKCHFLYVMYQRSKDESFLDGQRLCTRQFDKILFNFLNPAVKKAFRSPSYLGARLWDILPRDTQLSGGIHEFKNRIAKHVKNGMFTDVKI